MSRIDFSFLCLFMIQLFDLNLLVESSNANMSPWKDACDWYVRGGCEVYESYARRVRDRNAGQREERLGEIGLSYLRNVVQGGARPLALLYHVLPESLGSKQVQASACDLKLNMGKKSTATSGHNNAGDRRR